MQVAEETTCMGSAWGTDRGESSEAALCFTGRFGLVDALGFRRPAGDALDRVAGQLASSHRRTPVTPAMPATAREIEARKANGLDTLARAGIASPTGWNVSM